MSKYIMMVALIGFTVYGTAVGASQVPLEECASALAANTNPRLMSRTTAVRKARVICRNIRENDAYFFKALTQ